MNEISISYSDGIPKLNCNFEEMLSKRCDRWLNMLGIDNRLVSVLFCDRKIIRDLNKSYRNIDKVTDILSWKYPQDENSINVLPGIPWGELAVSIPVSKERAQHSGWTLEIELFRLFVHGLVHLCGYDHEESEEEEKNMLELELKLLSEFKLEYVYQS